MEVRIENFLLNEVVNFLFDVKLKGKESRHRTRFIRLLGDRLEKINAEKQELLKEHCNLDKKGEPKIIKDEDGSKYDVKDISAYSKDNQELMNEEYVVDGEDNKVMLMTVRDVLDNYDEEVSGREAVLYERLCEIFQVDEDINEEN